jgi:uncharacterized protein YcbK (DUF882 family)
VVEDRRRSESAFMRALPRISLGVLCSLLTSSAGAQQRPMARLAFAPPDGPHAIITQSQKKDRAIDARPTLLPPTITVASVHLREVIAWDETSDERGAPRRIDWILRDRTNWQSAAIDDRTLRAVRATCVQFGCDRIEVVSGYRSSKMNEMLRKKGRHVAQRSQHPMATAVDFRLVGIEMEPVFRWLERGHNGGVGRYRDDAFVHVDSGPRRRWRGE